jgi:hypothetical protein
MSEINVTKNPEKNAASNITIRIINALKGFLLSLPLITLEIL